MGVPKADVDAIINKAKSFGQGDVWQPMNELEVLFQYYSDQIKIALKTSLRNKNKKATGNLKDTLEAYTIQEGTSVGLQVELEPYYQFVNDGRTGRRRFGRDASRLVGIPKSKATPPPFDAISKWVRFKSVRELSKPGLGFKTRQTARVSDKVKKMRLVERIRWGIYWNGIKPTYFYTDTINQQLVNNIEADIYQLLGRTIELNISNVNNSK